MSSRSDYQHSSSSPQFNRRETGREDRSRSRSKGHRRRQERNQYRHKGSSRRQRIIKVPELSGELVSFSTFMSKQDEKISVEKVRQEYEVYKRDWEQKYNEAFLNDHKNDAWFRQKYDPEVLDAIELERKQIILNSAQEFFKHFKNGYYEKIDLRVKDPNRLGFVYTNNEREEEGEEMKQLTANKGTPVPITNQTFQINVASNIDLTGQPYYSFDPDINALFLKAVPRSISKYDIYEQVGKLKGFQTITLSQPVKKLSFSRYCWITFEDSTCLAEAQMAMNGLIIKEEPITVGRSISKNRRIKVLKNYPNSRIENDAKVCESLARKLDEECKIFENPLVTHKFTNPQQKFDTFLLYLRKVHAFDYFTSTSYINERTLCLKLGIAYLRMQADYEEVQNFDTVFKKIEQAALIKIEKGSQLPDYMGILREEIQKMVIKNIRQTQDISEQSLADRTAWQCFYCKKKFRSCQFLAKHMISKHSQPKETKIQTIMENAYKKDPNKLTNYPSGRQDRQNLKGRRPGFRRDRKREYKDLDEPQGGQTERTITKPMVNFLDI